jgi:hypothetical protein
LEFVDNRTNFAIFKIKLVGVAVGTKRLWPKTKKNKDGEWGAYGLIIFFKK